MMEWPDPVYFKAGAWHSILPSFFDFIPNLEWPEESL